MNQELRIDLDKQYNCHVANSANGGKSTCGTGPLGQQWATVSHDQLPTITDALTVEAFVHTQEIAAEGLQAVVSMWAPQKSFNQFSAYDASTTSGLDTAGFLGCIFDGRYIYFVPQRNTKHHHGNVLRYDTHSSFTSSQAWTGYDAGTTCGLNTKGYYGAVFDGRYVYFVPRTDGITYHTRVLRLDTTSDFTDASSWDAHDLTLGLSCQGAGFDGRYIYFCPGYKQEGGNSGLVCRHDTQGAFHHDDSWATYDASNTSDLNATSFDGAAFDGRYIYFIPLDTQTVLQYDTRLPFTDANSWRAQPVDQLGVTRCVGSVFDGQYLYLVPYGKTRVVVRYNTRGQFEDPGSWERYDASMTDGLATVGYDGGAFDGRYIYMIPFWNEKDSFHSHFLRYDTQGSFNDASSWQAVDASETDGLETIGYNAGAFDGRYLYCTPWHNGANYPNSIVGHGRVIRYDTLGNNGSFSLRCADYGHNGGLCAAVPGPSFIINTSEGVRSVAAHRALPDGDHHIAGVYDGRSIKLIIDGQLVARQDATGSIVSNDIDLSIGRINEGGGYFHGTISTVRVCAYAKTIEQICQGIGLPQDEEH